MRRLNAYALTFRLPIIIWQALFFIGPLIFVVAMSFFVVKNYRMVETFELTSWAKMISRDYVWSAYRYTLVMAGSAAAIASILAFPAAWFLAFRCSARARQVALLLLIVPFFTSYLVRTFSWYTILAEAGVLNGGFALFGLGPFKMLNTPFGTLVGYLTLVLPLVMILQTVTMANIDTRLVQAARNLGCTPARTIWSVILPAGKTGFVIAALFAFILSFGDFVAPFYLGGSNPPTMPILIIDTTKAGQQWPRAAVVAVMMMLTLFSIAFAAIVYSYRKRASR
ncbi:ABC transporter permease [Pseudaestuariivita atlantica]|uniref:Spermidine/putrescine ABC transporter permease n=1 Tax=Pseudaestuariivita atlantica TaxID=1317121 RepID=A0A0L1JMW5_9RHOB|nr:ABC transporter permease [Pseudaestuariivita atlantica]KNG93100.1 spermidine/putrescine ABC transporter permease [Pseudaestuariivita atlantica]